MEGLRFFYVLAHVVFADTSPLGRLLRSAARLPRGNLLKSKNMTSKTRLAPRSLVTVR
jgi:hypothetical protein